MTASGPTGPATPPIVVQRQSMECELFESLIHHLVEKGTLTRNDALSVVQTVAEVKQGSIEVAGNEATRLEAELVTLRRIYRSFEFLPDRQIPVDSIERGNVRILRPPLHDGHPSFPDEAD